MAGDKPDNKLKKPLKIVKPKKRVVVRVVRDVPPGKNKGGRPPLTPAEKTELVQKLKPFLNMGLSMRKACLEAKVSRSTVNDQLAVDEEFANQIAREKNYLTRITSSILYNKLMDIADKSGKKLKLTGEETEFVWKFVMTSGATKHEFGDRELAEEDNFEEMVESAREELRKESASDKIKRIIADRERKILSAGSKRSS